MKKILFIFCVFQSLYGWSQLQDVQQKILGSWEIISLNLSNDDANQENLSGEIWTFNNNGICEVKSDPNNPNMVTIYNYEISETNCATNIISNEFYYVKLINQTVVGEDYCFLISNIGKIDDLDQRDYLTLYVDEALKPNLLVKK